MGHHDVVIGQAERTDGLREAMAHRKWLGDLARKARVEPIAILRGRGLEDQPHEQPGAVGRVLVGVDDVPARVGQEARDASDDPGPVRAAEQQSRRLHRGSFSETTEAQACLGHERPEWIGWP
jgi:hypothetical protein